MTKEEKIKILDKQIDNIEKGNWSADFDGYGYRYSKEITDIFELLQIDEYRKMYEDNSILYNKKELEQNKDPDTYSLIECIVYFNWVWHVEGSRLAVGLIMMRIRNGKYLKALKQLRKLIVEG